MEINRSTLICPGGRHQITFIYRRGPFYRINRTVFPLNRHTILETVEQRPRFLTPFGEVNFVSLLCRYQVRFTMPADTHRTENKAINREKVYK